MSPLLNETFAGKTIRIEVGDKARDQLCLELSVVDGKVVQSRLEGIGCLPFLQLISQWREILGQAARDGQELSSLSMPVGVDHSAILLREAILRAQSRWNFPYRDEEICHCRAVATSSVDSAIIAGCHNLDRIKQATSASTSCGSCRSDIENILRYRLSASGRIETA